jgi:hypothetical protein
VTGKCEPTPPRGSVEGFWLVWQISDYDFLRIESDRKNVNLVKFPKRESLHHISFIDTDSRSILSFTDFN